MLLSPNQEKNMDCVRVLLNNFVLGVQRLYGKGFVSYNVHSLVHLPDDYMKWGSLDTVSCFQFESYLGQYVKGRLTGRNRPLEQVCRHVSSQNSNVHVIRPAVTSTAKMFYTDKNFKCSTTIRDNCVLLKSGEIVLINQIIGEDVDVDVFKSITPFLSKPFNSQKVGIFQVDDKIHKGLIRKIDISSKMILLPYMDTFVGIKLLHT
jgi:hypothetical protein